MDEVGAVPDRHRRKILEGGCHHIVVLPFAADGRIRIKTFKYGIGIETFGSIGRGAGIGKRAENSLAIINAGTAWHQQRKDAGREKGTFHICNIIHSCKSAKNLVDLFFSD
jgi:hypothetical protein